MAVPASGGEARRGHGLSGRIYAKVSLSRWMVDGAPRACGTGLAAGPWQGLIVQSAWPAPCVPACLRSGL